MLFSFEASNLLARAFHHFFSIDLEPSASKSGGVDVAGVATAAVAVVAVVAVVIVAVVATVSVVVAVVFLGAAVASHCC